MLISLSRNQQRVISRCNNDLSVTRSWPFITRHLRCFLTKCRNRCRKGAQPFHDVQCQLQRLGMACGSNSHRRYWGHPASTASQSQPDLSSNQKGSPSGQNLTFFVAKKADKNNQKNPSAGFDISKEKLLNFIFQL